MHEDTPEKLARLDKIARRERNAQLFKLGKRWCKTCQQVKPLAKFAKHWKQRSRKHYYDHDCVSCTSKGKTDYRRSHPEYVERQRVIAQAWRRRLLPGYYRQVWMKRKRRKLGKYHLLGIGIAKERKGEDQHHERL